MKKNMTNEAFVTGYIYSHDLKEKVTGPTSKNPGTEFILHRVYVDQNFSC